MAQVAGGVFPEVGGSNLNSVRYELPADFEGEVNLVLLVFTQQQQLQANTWLPYAVALAERSPGLRVYELPTLTRVDGLFRAYTDAGMRSGIPEHDARARTITLYIDRAQFLSELGLPGTQTIYTLLVKPSGEVLWTTEGEYTEAKARELESLLPRTLGGT